MPVTPEMRRGVDQVRDYLYGSGYPEHSASHHSQPDATRARDNHAALVGCLRYFRSRGSFIGRRSPHEPHESTIVGLSAGLPRGFTWRSTRRRTLTKMGDLKARARVQPIRSAGAIAPHHLPGSDIFNDAEAATGCARPDFRGLKVRPERLPTSTRLGLFLEALCPRAGGGRAQIVEHHLGLAGRRLGDEIDCLEVGRMRQIWTDPQPREKSRPASIEPGVTERLRQVVALQVHRTIGNIPTCLQACCGEVLALHLLGCREVDLDDPKIGNEVGTPVTERIHAGAKDHVLLKASPDCVLQAIFAIAHPQDHIAIARVSS